MRNPEVGPGTRKLKGVTVNDGEGGTVFYHKHMAPKARRGKKNSRKQKKASRRRNRK